MQQGRCKKTPTALSQKGQSDGQIRKAYLRPNKTTASATKAKIKQ